MWWQRRVVAGAVPHVAVPSRLTRTPCTLHTIQADGRDVDKYAVSHTRYAPNRVKIRHTSPMDWSYGRPWSVTSPFPPTSLHLTGPDPPGAAEGVHRLCARALPPHHHRRSSARAHHQLPGHAQEREGEEGAWVGGWWSAWCHGQAQMAWLTPVNRAHVETRQVTPGECPPPAHAGWRVAESRRP